MVNDVVKIGLVFDGTKNCWQILSRCLKTNKNSLKKQQLHFTCVQQNHSQCKLFVVVILENDTIFLKQFKYLNGLNYVAHLIAAGQVLELNSSRERNEKKHFSLTD